jgi:ElaB/YqjD/DUF883 family membrane-anchored ribosome-binding protein
MKQFHKTQRRFEMDKVEKMTNDAATYASDTMDRARDMGREALDRGTQNAREYVSKGLDYAGEASDGLAEFVQRQPWIALAGAFVVGYIAAKALRQLSL